MNNYFETILTVLAIVTTIAVVFLIPYYKSKTTKEQRQAHREIAENYISNLEIFLTHVENLVKATEQQIKGTAMGAKKFEEVKGKLTKRYTDLINDLGITQSEIDDFIESAVYDLNKSKDDIKKALEE